MHHKNIELYFDLYIYERNSFPPYKVILDHFNHSIKFHLKDCGQHHQRIEHSQHHVQGKRLQHRRFPWRQKVQPECFEIEYQAGDFKHLCKRMTHSHNQEVHTIHKGSSTLHHTLCALHEIHEAYDKFSCIIHN